MRVNNYDWKTCYLTVSGKDTNRGQTDGNKSCRRKKKNLLQNENDNQEKYTDGATKTQVLLESSDFGRNMDKRESRLAKDKEGYSQETNMKYDDLAQELPSRC